MSISAKKVEEQEVYKTKFFRTDIIKSAKKVCEKLNFPIFDLAFIFCILITGLGLLFGAIFPFYWIAMLFVLIIIEFLIDIFGCRHQEINLESKKLDPK